MDTKMLVVTNRRLEDAHASDASMFGELPNAKGPGEVRLAWVERDDKGWRVTLVEEPGLLHLGNLPSRHDLRRIQAAARRAQGRIARAASDSASASVGDGVTGRASFPLTAAKAGRVTRAARPGPPDS